MSGEIHVERYPGNDGKLYRDGKGIVYKGTNEGVTALGYDDENIGIILPIDSDGMRALVPEGVDIDSSLARECKLTGGLSASCFQAVGGVILYVPINPLLIPEIPPMIYQPVSLYKRVCDYIVENRNWVEFNLGSLPVKTKNYITLHLKLSDKQEELTGIEYNNDTLIVKFETSYLDKMEEINSTHLQHIFMMNRKFTIDTRKLEDEHFRAMKELKKIAADKKAKILSEISELKSKFS